jgi:hypothetical protein
MATKKYLDYDGLVELVEKIKEKYAPIQALTFKGTVATISALPTVANVAGGYVYNIVSGGETTADFVEGAGQVLQDGENVVAVNLGTDDDPVMKWDILGGVFNIEDRLQFGNTMPVSPENSQTFLYMGDTTYSYTAVSPTGDENPVEEGWYEYDSANDEYVVTSDTTVQSGTSYFARSEQYVKGVIYVYSSISTSWVAQSSGDTFTPITIAEVDSLFD